jgi:hypothetical protein
MGLKASNTAATTAAVANRFVTTVNMKVGAYTIANASPVWAGGCLVTVTHTEVGGGVDTLGTIAIVGTDLGGATITDTITPLNGTVATSTKVFRTVVSATGAGWVIGVGNDTIVIGCAAGNIVAGSGGTLGGILVNNSVAAAIVISDATGTLVTVPSSQAAGTYYNLQGVDFAGFLKVATTSTNDVTVFHSRTIPAYATS